MSEVRELVFGDRDLGVELTFVFSWMWSCKWRSLGPQILGDGQISQNKYKLDESNRAIQRLQDKDHLRICAPP